MMMPDNVDAVTTIACQRPVRGPRIARTAPLSFTPSTDPAECWPSRSPTRPRAPRGRTTGAKSHSSSTAPATRMATDDRRAGGGGEPGVRRQHGDSA